MPKKTTKRKGAKQYLYRKTAKGEFVYVGTVSRTVKAKKVYAKRKRRGRGLGQKTIALKTFGGLARRR